MPIYTSGAANIFDYPELSESSKAKGLVQALGDKKGLAELIRGAAPDDSGDIRAYIGNEAPIQGMTDCSVVTANYNLGDGMKGTVAIVGPRRMDYKKVVDNLKQLKKQMQEMFGDGDAQIGTSRQTMGIEAKPEANEK